MTEKDQPEATAEADDPDEPYRAIRALLDEIDAHPGTRARREWDALTVVHEIFRGNERELLEMLEAIHANHNDVAITMAGNMTDRDLRLGLYRELLRRLHNYLASVVTFVDHTRNLTRRYEGTATKREYDDRVSTFTAEGVARFITKLRSYLLHYRLPQVGVQVSVDQGVESFLCFLNRDVALEWPDWPVAAREFLMAQERLIPVREVVRSYSALIEDLYRWLYEQFPVLHAADIEAVNKLITKTTGWRKADGSLGMAASDTE